MDKPCNMKAFSTEQLVHIASKNKDSNAGPTVACLNNLNPNGWHILEPIMVHNDIELRCRAAMCFKEHDDPIFILMDIGFEDYEQGHDPEHIHKMAEAINQSVKENKRED